MAVPTMTPRERFLAAARRRPVDRTPIWLMRQAGRWLPEYRALREGRAFMDMVRDPALAAELTCQPIRRFDFDAAVIFSDILVPASAMGVGVRFEEGRGPILEPVSRDRVAIERLEPFDPEESTGFLAEAIRRVRAELGPDRAIVGFCGAPFTVASYIVEGGSTRAFTHTKELLARDPALFAELLTRVVEASIPYLAMQVEAGADVLQIFDSWAGFLDHATYAAHVLPHLSRLVCVAKAIGVPLILYANHAAHLTDLLVSAGPDVLSLDASADVASAVGRWRSSLAFQGNLDHEALLGEPEAAAAAARATLERFKDANGHIFNLGSGCVPATRIDCVQAVVDVVRASPSRP